MSESAFGVDHGAISKIAMPAAEAGGALKALKGVKLPGMAGIQQKAVNLGNHSAGLTRQAGSAMGGGVGGKLTSLGNKMGSNPGLTGKIVGGGAAAGAGFGAAKMMTPNKPKQFGS